MKTENKCTVSFFLAILIFALLLLVNIRVAAGLGTPLERAVDGLVGGIVLLLSVFLALRFFQCDRTKCKSDSSA